MFRFFIIGLLAVAAGGVLIWQVGPLLSPEDPGKQVTSGNGSVEPPINEAPLQSDLDDQPLESRMTRTPGQPLFDPITIENCDLSVIDAQEVPSMVDGNIEEISVEIGMRVLAEQVLAELDKRELLIQKDTEQRKANSTVAETSAREEHNVALEEVKRSELMLRNNPGSVSQQEYGINIARERLAREKIKQAEETRAEAQNTLKLVNERLDKHSIRSAIPGVVTDIFNKKGEAVRQSNPVFRIENFDHLKIRGRLGAEYSNQIRPGMTAQVETETPSGAMYQRSGHTAPITGLAVSPDHRFLASSSEDGKVFLWLAPSLSGHYSLSHPAEVYAIAAAYAPGDTSTYVFLSGCADGSARLWYVKQGEKIKFVTFTAHQGAIRAVAFSPDFSHCATAGDDKQVCLWDISETSASGAAVMRYKLQASSGGSSTAHRQTVTSIHFTPDGHIVTAGQDSLIKVWNIADDSANLVGQYAGRTGDVAQLGVSNDGQHLLFDHGDELRILDRDTFSTLGTIRNQGKNAFQSFSIFSPSGRMILTNTASDRVQVWNFPAPYEEAMILREAYRHGFRRNSLHVLGAISNGASPLGVFNAPINNTWLWTGADPVPLGEEPMASARGQSLIPRLWPITAREVRHLVAPDSARPNVAVFSPDESLIYVAGADRIIRVYGTPSPDELSYPLEARITLVGSRVQVSDPRQDVQAYIDNPINPLHRLKPGSKVHLTLFPETGN